MIPKIIIKKVRGEFYPASLSDNSCTTSQEQLIQRRAAKIVKITLSMVRIMQKLCF